MSNLHNAVLEALELLQMPPEVIVERGSRRSGNWAHRGRVGKKGGSLPGGGHKVIGVRPGDGKTRGQLVRASKEKRESVKNIMGAVLGAGGSDFFDKYEPAQITNMVINTLGATPPGSKGGKDYFDHITAQAVVNAYAKHHMKKSGNKEAIVLPEVLGKKAPLLAPTDTGIGSKGKRGKIKVKPGKGSEYTDLPEVQVAANIAAHKKAQAALAQSKNQHVFGGNKAKGAAQGKDLDKILNEPAKKGDIPKKNKPSPKQEPTKPSPATTVNHGPGKQDPSYTGPKPMTGDIADPQPLGWNKLHDSQKDMGNLPTAQKSAIASYGGSGYMSINSHLRKGTTATTQTKGNIAEIDKAFNNKSATVPIDAKVWRGTQFAVYSDQLGPDPSTWVGKTFTDKGYMSTTITESKAFSGLRAQINVPKGSKGIFMPTVGVPHTLEDELLLPRGTKMRILALIV